MHDSMMFQRARMTEQYELEQEPRIKLIQDKLEIEDWLRQNTPDHVWYEHMQDCLAAVQKKLNPDNRP